MIILPGSCTMLFHTQTGEKVPDESYALAHTPVTQQDPTG